MDEYNKMIQGLLYDANDPFLDKKRKETQKLCNKYNNTGEGDIKKRDKILKKLMPDKAESAFLRGPIHFDYGFNTTMGDFSYANFNFTVLDVCKVNIGKHVYMGPNVTILTAMHPFSYKQRNMYFDKQKNYYTDKEYGKPVTIKDNCWICSNVTILPGVTIGSGCVIGAGSVVTKDIKDNMLAYGNPCKEIKEIDQEEKEQYEKDIY